MMSACNRDILSAFVDAELTLPQRRDVERHVQSCAPCAAEVEDLRRINSILAAWGATARPFPPVTDARVASSIDRRRGRRAVAALSRLTPAAFGSAVAALVVAFSVNSSALTHRSSSSAAGSSLAGARQISDSLHRIRSQSAILGVQVESQATLFSPRRLALLDVQ
ncbi:MAG: hypothetical protein NVS4B2_01310 [Chloroflexota bacterium]